MQSNAEDRRVSLWHIGDLFRLDGPGGALLNSLHDGVYVADESDTILFWNRAAETVTGLAAEQVVGRECGSNLFVSSTLPHHADAGTGNAMWFGAPTSTGRVENKYAVHRSGRHIPVKINASPISDGIGGVAGSLVVFWDVSTASEDDTSSQASRVNELLQHYVSRETFEMAKLAARGEKPDESVQSEMTVMFVDIARFTSFAEKSSPTEVRALLNEFLALCEDVILANKGDIDKFIGDCAMAVFRDPNDAVTAGRELLKTLRARNRAAAARGTFELHVRMGIHTGNVVHGDIGGPGRKDCTVVGDAVNTASRLERLGDVDAMLISRATFSRLLDPTDFLFVGTTLIRGRSEFIRLYVG